MPRGRKAAKRREVGEQRPEPEARAGKGERPAPRQSAGDQADVASGAHTRPEAIVEAAIRRASGDADGAGGDPGDLPSVNLDTGLPMWGSDERIRNQTELCHPPPPK